MIHFGVLSLDLKRIYLHGLVHFYNIRLIATSAWAQTGEHPYCTNLLASPSDCAQLDHFYLICFMTFSCFLIFLSCKEI